MERVRELFFADKLPIDSCIHDFFYNLPNPGKTTTFRMLTGDEGLTSGNAFSFMNTLRTNKTDFLANIGYCPQFDAIIGSLSGREMLTLFCHLRGVPFNETNTEVDKWLGKLGKCMNWKLLSFGKENL